MGMTAEKHFPFWGQSERVERKAGLQGLCMLPDDPSRSPDRRSWRRWRKSCMADETAGRQTRYLNRLEKRTGSLWDVSSRARSAPMRIFWPCSRYVGLNPVRAGIIAEDYRWPGYGSKTGNKKEAWLDFDPFILYFKKSRTLMIGISRKQPISRRSLSPLTIASTPPATAQERKISSHGSRQTPWMFSQDSTTSK